MFKVYICLFKVYIGVRGVKGSFTFTLTVFKVEIASKHNDFNLHSTIQCLFLLNLILFLEHSVVVITKRESNLS